MTKFCKIALSVFIAAVIGENAANAKDDDYTPPAEHFIKAVTDTTFHEEVVDSLLPVVLDVCVNCLASINRTERLAIHYSGKARFFQLPLAANNSFQQRLDTMKIVPPVYVIAIGEHLFPGRPNMTDAEVKAFIEFVLSSGF
ncbi:MAG: hypothetical protein HYX67_06935 [Candidatus Melainabacteria bacterium]|nr:hypothetical protein [Candidatus Melainabacteria bacterium]